MAARAEIRAAAAAAALEVAKSLGVQVGYSHRGGSPATVWAVPSKVSRGRAVVVGSPTQADSQSFSIPFQAGLPDGGPELKDTITYGGHRYSITAIDSDSLAACFAAHAVRRQVRSVK
ncbi:MAG TPA: hypothetical protein VGP72_10465 [Planctomycetota bacterium]|jgi:hypothetical protein